MRGEKAIANDFYRPETLKYIVDKTLQYLG